MNSSKLMKNATIAVVNLAILGFAARWVDANIRLAELASVLQRVSPMALATVAVINLLVLVFFAYRLAVLTDVRPRVAFNVACLGSGLNGLLPFRLGDVARVYYSKRLYGVSATKLAAASFVEKLFDLAALGLMLLTIALTGGSRLIDAGLVLILSAMIGAGLLVLFVLLRYAHLIGARVSGSEFMRTVISSLQHHLRIRRKVAVSLATVAMWLANLLVVYAGLSWFLPGVEIRALDATVVLLIIALAIAVPGAPAGLGIFEAGVVAYLALVFRVGSEEALATALLLHLAISLPTIVLCLGAILNPRRCAQV